MMGSGAKMGDAAPGRSAANLALEELQQFEGRVDIEGVDPDAPAAMKASPSGSEDSGENASAS